MKRITYLLFLMMPFALMAQSNVAQYNLEIEVVGLCSNEGNIQLQLMRANDSIFKSMEAPIAKKTCTVHLDSVPEGIYRVQYYHDENLNKEMDSNFIGIPKEGYGFSNNPDSKYGPPPAEQMLFSLAADSLIVINNVQW